MKTLTGQDWLRVVKTLVIFIVWTLTAFLCHQCAKSFLQQCQDSIVSQPKTRSMLDTKSPQDTKLSPDTKAPLDTITSLDVESPVTQILYRLYFGAIVTLSQVMSCLMLLVQEVMSALRQLSWRRLSLVFLTHILVTLATNCSLAFTEASSTLAIKMTEPVIMAFGHYVFCGKLVSSGTAVVLFGVLAGTLVFADLNFYNTYNTIGICLAFASVIMQAARDASLQTLQPEAGTQTSSTLRRLAWIGQILLGECLLLAGVHYLEVRELISNSLSVLTAWCLVSGLSHVADSYIPTTTALKEMHAHSYSLLTLLKRLLVVLMLTVSATRHISPLNWAGLAVAVGGLYVFSRVPAPAPAPSFDSTTKTIKIEFTLRKHGLVLVGLLMVSFFSLDLLARVALMDKGSNPHLDRHDLTELEISQLDLNYSHIHWREHDPKIKEFLSLRLVDHPEEVSKRILTLTSNRDIIEEAQRILVNVLHDLLGPVRFVMLFHIPMYQNKGDPTITVGELMLLRLLKVSLVYYCEYDLCGDKESVDKAYKIISHYPEDQVAILLHGGGNIIGYPENDVMREITFKNFPNIRLIMLPQSIWLFKAKKHIDYCRTLYSNRSNLVMILRDKDSFHLAGKFFVGTKLVLAPDSAFAIGHRSRQVPPLYDIVWLKRTDNESSSYRLPVIDPKSNITVKIEDWINWNSNTGDNKLQSSLLTFFSGLQFLERGRIVVTDRLHGHIMCTLMNIPHVLIDNPPYFKLSNFYRTWTGNLKNSVLVRDGEEAWTAALKMLARPDLFIPAKIKTDAQTYD